MTIKLIESGGIVPVNKEAATEVSWSREECAALLKTMAFDAAGQGLRDAITHSLQIEDGSAIEIDLSKAPSKYKTVFRGLVKNLQYSRR